MTVKERNAFTGTAFPELDLQLRVPDRFISVKLPRTNIDSEDMLVHRRVAMRQGGALTLGGAYIWELALLLEGLAGK